MSNLNSPMAVCDHNARMGHDRTMAPVGSMDQEILEPPTEVRIPKPLMKRSLWWSSRRIRAWELLVAQGPAVQEEGELDGECDGDGDDRGEMQRCLAAVG